MRLSSRRRCRRHASRRGLRAGRADRRPRRAGAFLKHSRLANHRLQDDRRRNRHRPHLCAGAAALRQPTALFPQCADPDTRLRRLSCQWPAPGCADARPAWPWHLHPCHQLERRAPRHQRHPPQICAADPVGAAAVDPGPGTLIRRSYRCRVRTAASVFVTCSFQLRSEWTMTIFPSRRMT